MTQTTAITVTTATSTSMATAPRMHSLPLHALDIVNPTKWTLILWYTGIPPHHIYLMAASAKKEQEQYPNDSTDWVKLSLLAKEKNHSIFSFGLAMGENYLSYYILLSQLTSGVYLSLSSEENGMPFLPTFPRPSIFSKPSSTTLDLAKDIPTSPNAYSVKVVQIDNKEKHEVMQKWLEGSFDLRAEIKVIAKKAPVDEAIVWVYLDPDSDMELIRRELLEVSRSCNSDMLREFATIFMHLKVVNPAVPLPAD